MIENSENMNLSTIHFIGIGGIGLSAIAKLCLHNGYNVQGSDIKNSDTIKSLVKMGIKVFVGHNSNNINTKIEKVIYSSAVNSKNPEFIKAKRSQYPNIFESPNACRSYAKKEVYLYFWYAW